MKSISNIFNLVISCKTLLLGCIFNCIAFYSFSQFPPDCTLDSSSIARESDKILNFINTSDYTYALSEISLARKHLDSCNIDEIEYEALLYHFEALINTNKNEFQQALLSWTAAIEILESSSEPNKSQLAKYTTNLGSIHFYQNDLENALKYMELGLDYSIQLFGGHNIEILDNQFNLAQVYAEIGRYSEAIELHLNMIGTLNNQVDIDYLKLLDSYISLARLTNELGDFQKSLAFQDNAFSLIDHHTILDYEALGILNDTKGFTHLGLNEFDLALNSFKKAQEYFVKQFGENHYYVSSVLNNQGLVYDQVGKYESAISVYSKSLTIDKVFFGNFHPRMAATYSNIGITYTHKGEHSKALEYFKAAKDLFLFNNDLLGKELSAVERNIVLAKISVGDTDDISSELNSIIEKRKIEVGPRHPDVLSLTISLGIEYIRINKNKEAINLFNNTIQYLETNETKDSSLIRSAHFHLGQALVNQDMISEGIDQVEKSINILINAHSEAHPDLILYYRALGNIYISQKEFAKGEKYFNKSQSIYNDVGGDLQLLNLPQYILTLESLATAHRKHFELSKKTQYLDLSYSVFNQAKSMIDTMYKYVNNGSRIDIASISDNIFFGSSITSLEKYRTTDSSIYLETLFDFSERSKSAVLLDSYRKTGAQFDNIAQDSMFQRSIELKDELNFYEKEMHEAVSNNSQVKDPLKIREKIFELKQQIDRSNSSSTNSLKPINFDTIINYLTPNQTLLEYSISDSLGIILLVNYDTIIVKEIKFEDSLKRAVEMIRSGVSGSHLTSSVKRTSMSTNANNYIKNAHYLYQMLIAPVKDQLNEHLIIVPDDELGYIPFGILLTELPNELIAFHKYPYLIKGHKISYNYSSSLLIEMTNKIHKKEVKQRSLAIAPFITKDYQEIIGNRDTTNLMEVRGDTLTPLRFSLEEATNVADITNGESWLGKTATVQKFKEKAADFNLLHLSTHGIADDRVGDFAYLAMSNPSNPSGYEKLYVRDIYNIPLNADMVTLSACRTGFGKLQKGEGIISLARAFAYAGAKSIITTHWNVEDKSTASIMTSFYQYLAQGLTKDAALQNAKIDFIENKKSLKAHPFYWGGIFAIGDMSAIQ